MSRHLGNFLSNPCVGNVPRRRLNLVDSRPFPARMVSHSLCKLQIGLSMIPVLVSPLPTRRVGSGLASQKMRSAGAGIALGGRFLGSAAVGPLPSGFQSKLALLGPRSRILGGRNYV